MNERKTSEPRAAAFFPGDLPRFTPPLLPPMAFYYCVFPSTTTTTATKKEPNHLPGVTWSPPALIGLSCVCRHPCLTPSCHPTRRPNPPVKLILNPLWQVEQTLQPHHHHHPSLPTPPPPPPPPPSCVPWMDGGSQTHLKHDARQTGVFPSLRYDATFFSFLGAFRGDKALL